MKIALIRQKYTPFGGAERYMSRLIERLVAEGHEVHVFAAQWESGGNPAVTVHPVPVVGLTGWLKALTFSLNCRKLLHRETFDVIFSLERTLLQTVYRAGDGCHRQWLKQKNLGKGLVSRLLTYANPFQLAYLHLERKMLTDEKLQAIIANSRRGKDEIVRLYGVAPEKITVVYNGIDGAEFDLGRRDQHREALAEEFALHDEIRLLYVGSGFKRKGVPALLEAAALLTVPFKLFIVGKGPVEQFRRRAEKLGIGRNVVFTGPRKDVQKFYLGCDVFVFPTLYDPFSNATLEAMACGLPVVTSAYNGAAEIISDNVNGFVVRDPLNAEEIAAAITTLCPEEVRTRMGRSAAETVAAFTMERNVRETLAVLERSHMETVKPAEPVKFLLIRLSSFGDIILTTPAIRLLRNAFPNAVIDYVVYDRFRSVLAEHPDVRNVMALPKKNIKEAFGKRDLAALRGIIGDFVKELRSESYDYVIDFHNVTDSALVALLARGRLKVGHRKQLLTVFFDRRSTFDDGFATSKIHAARANMMYLADAGCVAARDIPAAPRLEFFLPASAALDIDLFLQKENLNGRRLLGINPCASFDFKRWSEEGFAAVADRLAAEYGFQVLLFGSPGEREIVQRVRGLMNHPAMDTSHLSMPQAFELIRRLDLFVTNDSAPMHVAAAFGTPLVALHGPINVARFFPLTDKSRSISRALPCLPCKDIRKCTTRECFTSVTVDEVCGACRDLLEELGFTRHDSKRAVS